MNASILLFQIFNLLATLSVACILFVFLKPSNADREKALGPIRQSLKPWTKKEKRKPKYNDDNASWKKENNIE